MPDKTLIDNIIAMEWKMFSSVNEGGPKASCQEDPVTFDGMRRGQFSAWSQEAAESYYEDVKKAAATGRNLAMEKYIHMMKSTAPAQYELLLPRVVYPSKAAIDLAEKITAKMVEQTARILKMLLRHPDAVEELADKTGDNYSFSVFGEKRTYTVVFTTTTQSIILIDVW